MTRLKGSHSVYKRGNVWLAVVEYPRDPKTGKRVRQWSEGFRTRKEAEAERDRLRNAVRSGIDSAPEKLTVSALLDRWISSKTNLSPTTRERYVELADRVKPHLGGILVAKLRPAHVQELYSTLLSKCRTCTRFAEGAAPEHKCAVPLGATSVRHLHALLKSVFAWAVRMQILPRNPVEVVAQDAPTRAVPKTDAYTDAEVIALLDAAKGTRWDAALLLAIATGMRRGELAALRREDVRIERNEDGTERGSILVRASFCETKVGVVLKSTKSGRERSVPLSSLAIEALGMERLRQSEDAFKAEDGYADHGFAFQGSLGAPYAPMQFTEAFRSIRKAAGVLKRLHDARHTMASHLLAAGVDVRTAATILGHSSPQTTLTVYAHQMAGMQEAAISKLDDRLRAAIKRRERE